MKNYFNKLLSTCIFILLFVTVEAQINTQEGQVSGRVTKNKILEADISSLGTNVNSKVCFVNFAGNSHNLNEFHVQIQPRNTSDGFSSHWPEWAYMIAKDAFLHDKKI